MKLVYVMMVDCGIVDDRYGKEKYYQMYMIFFNDLGCVLIDYENNSIKQKCEMYGNSMEYVQGEVGVCNDLWVIREILVWFQMLVDKEEEKERSDLVCKCWMEVVEVIDRCLFWLFIFGILFLIIILLVVIFFIWFYDNYGDIVVI